MPWQVQDAKARFSEFLEASLKKGPQVVTRRGVETAVLVPIEEWRRLNDRARPTLKDWLLAPEPRFDDFPEMIPKRGRVRRRSVGIE
ncbi:MAG: type II toxin-antitoxin system Phd/YefM family antitoxin [Acidobacteriaceae bacterium]